MCGQAMGVWCMSVPGWTGLGWTGLGWVGLGWGWAGTWTIPWVPDDILMNFWGFSVKLPKHSKNYARLFSKFYKLSRNPEVSETHFQGSYGLFFLFISASCIKKSSNFELFPGNCSTFGAALGRSSSDSRVATRHVLRWVLEGLIRCMQFPVCLLIKKMHFALDPKWRWERSTSDAGVHELGSPLCMRNDQTMRAWSQMTLGEEYRNTHRFLLHRLYTSLSTTSWNANLVFWIDCT